MMAKLLGGGTDSCTDVPASAVASLLGLLARIGKTRWQPTGGALTLGEERTFEANVPPNLPAKSALIFGDAGPWYVDAAAGTLGRVRLRAPRGGRKRSGDDAYRGSSAAAASAKHHRAETGLVAFAASAVRSRKPTAHAVTTGLQYPRPPRRAQAGAGRRHSDRARHPGRDIHPGAQRPPDRLPR